MNNADFKNLVQNTPRRVNDDGEKGTSKFGAPSTLLGSRNKSSIPMTPRSVRGNSSVDFMRQVAEQNGLSKSQKQFRSYTPKGLKLADGYQDRALARAAEHQDESTKQDDREARIKALEEQMKLGQIDRALFEQLRDQVTGGDIRATHLVKGLDRQLLERIRKGEDVLSSDGADRSSKVAQEGKSAEIDMDAELEELEQKEVVPVEKEHTIKKGEMAPPPLPVAGIKRSRNDILAELKAARKAAAESKAVTKSQLGSKFRKIGDKQASSRIEVDAKGREILITIDEDGHVKRKVRKVAQYSDSKSAKESKPLPMPESHAKPLGMVIPEILSKPVLAEEEEDDDIFEGVGTDYDPLGALDDNDASSDSDSEQKPDKNVIENKGKVDESDSRPLPNEPSASEEVNDTPTAPPRRNYFGDKPIETDSSNATTKSLFLDPSMLATIKRAAAIAARTADDSSESKADSKPSSAAQRLLSRQDRDLDDIDMGFGSSRFDDAEDADGAGERVKLSQWKGAGKEGEDEDDGDEKTRGGKQRKRGKKKRKGDKDSAADVLKVIEARNKK